MADVYLGRHITLNRPVAVKVMQAHLSEDEGLLNRFTAEAQSVAAMRHPNIVQVFDFDVADDRPYIVMELLEGLSLKDYLQALRKAGAKLSSESIAHLTAMLASALDYAHARGIVHRDVKPANVMLRAESSPITPDAPLPADVEPVLTDFGVARIADAGQHTASGVIIGTPAYMSPEQASGTGIDARSDIYSLGVMLYEMLTDSLPFDGETQASILVKHLTEPVPEIPNASPEVQQVMDRALAKKPEQRFQSAGDLAQALTTALGLPIPRISVEVTPMPPTRAHVSDADTLPVGQAVTPDTVTAAGASTDVSPAMQGPNRVVIAGGIGALAVIAVVVALVTGVFGGGTEVTPAATEPLAIAETTPTTSAPTEVATTPTPDADVVTGEETPPTIDTTMARGVVVFRDATLAVSLSDLEAAPAGLAYWAWLTEPDAEPLRLGKAEVVDGQVSLAYADAEGRSLLTLYGGFALSLEAADDADPATPSQIAYAGEVAPETLQRLRQLDAVSRGAPLKQAVLSGLPVQAQHYDSHLGFAVGDITGGNLQGGKMHSEHTINIIVGSQSEDFSDWDNNGRAENPGDEFGLLPYLLTLKEAAQAAAAAPDSTPEMKRLAEEIAQTLGEVIPVIDQALSLAKRIASTDAVEEAQPLAVQMEELRVKGKIDLLLQEAEGLNMTVIVEVFPAGP